jgi:enoyl-CoA hydratase
VTAYQHLHVTVDDDGIALVEMDRPPVNAVSQDMYRELYALFSTIADDPAVKVVVLTGRGKHFCGGNDLEEFSTLTPENSPGRMWEVRRAYWAIHDCPIPVIAAVGGACLGTGVSLAGHSDFVIAAEDARIGLPEVSVGVMGGAKHLRRMVPEPILRWCFLTGEPAPIDLLLRIGAVIEVVPRDELVEAAKAQARKIARHSGVAVRIGKRTLNVIEDLDIKYGYEIEQGSTGLLSGFADSEESRHATMERRPANHNTPPEDLRRASEVEIGRYS